jgi:hypothetical protein
MDLYRAGLLLILILLFAYNVKVVYLKVQPDGSTKKVNRRQWVLFSRKGEVTLKLGSNRGSRGTWRMKPRSFYCAICHTLQGQDVEDRTRWNGDQDGKSRS